MKRSKKIVVVSHCVLNQNSVISDWERAKGAFPFMSDILKEGVGIIQLPCPELMFGGCNRPPKTYEEYNTDEYRNLCKQLASLHIPQIKEYLNNGYLCQGIIGIQNSPTCSISNQRGVFMEEIFEELKRQDISLEAFEVADSGQSDLRRVSDETK